MLPIGSVIYLKDGREKLMILNRGPIIANQEGNQVRFDYSACLYPVGLVPEQVFYFNQENIDKVVFEGLKDEEEEHFQDLFQQWEKEQGATIPKGHISQNPGGTFGIK